MEIRPNTNNSPVQLMVRAVKRHGEIVAHPTKEIAAFLL